MKFKQDAQRQSPRKQVNRQVVLAAIVLCWSGFAAAAIAPGLAYLGSDLTAKAKYEGNGELALVVYDSDAKVSYTKDLGLDLNSFFISAQQESFTQLFIPVVDKQWTDFLGLVDAGKLKWALFGADAYGTNAPGQKRFFTTATQGSEDKIALLSNGAFSDFVADGTGPSGYFQWVNETGTHGVSGTVANFFANGSSVNEAASNPKSYFGSNSTAFSDTALGKLAFSMGNDVGKSSWFYYLTRSSLTNRIATVLVDEFDNVGNDGYWGFTKVPDNANSPYKGQYLLSYTLEASTPKASTVLGQARINMTDFSAGFMARAYVPASTEFEGYRPGSLVVLSTSLSSSVSAVPEPASWGLMALGLLALGGRARRLRHAKRLPC